MKDEWNRLDLALKKGKMAVVTGLRRYGKTSLMLTYLNETGKRYVYIDCKFLPPAVSLKSFMSFLEAGLSNVGWGRKLLEKVSLAEVSLGGLGLKFKNKEEENLLRTLKALEGSVLVIDEAQILRNSAYRFDSLLAYIFDNLDIKLIISGSEVGLLYRFLKADDPSAPLYGRAFSEIGIKPLPRDRAREFLAKGFEQEKVPVDERVLDEAVENLDGIIGWLTYFGYSYVTGEADVKRIYESASKLAAEELKNALKLYGEGEPRYREALKIVATLRSASWSEIKRGIGARLGEITDSKLSNILKNLKDSGFIIKDEKGYSVSDPVLARGILSYL
ncbi:MAG: AAA family ATPase [Candidatus Bathyarchaeia archaeon]